MLLVLSTYAQKHITQLQHETPLPAMLPLLVEAAMTGGLGSRNQALLVETLGVCGEPWPAPFPECCIINMVATLRLQAGGCFVALHGGAPLIPLEVGRSLTSLFLSPSRCDAATTLRCRRRPRRSTSSSKYSSCCR